MNDVEKIVSKDLQERVGGEVLVAIYPLSHSKNHSLLHCVSAVLLATLLVLVENV